VPVRVHILGARGSTPAPGPDFVRYGGHTSCVALAHDGKPPSLIIDGGTGIRKMDQLLGGSPFRGTLVLGHFHWDHTQGIPFFRAGDRSDASVALLAPHQGPGTDIESVLAGAMSPPHFPISPAGLRGDWSFDALEEGATEIEGFRVLALEIPHSPGRTFGYRFSDGRSTVSYLSDHCPTTLGPGPDGLGEYHDNALRLVEGADLVLHDSQYADEELAERAAFGHAAVGYSVRLAEKAGARGALMFHHDPWRTDPEVDDLVARYGGSPVPVRAAAEGATLSLSG
jgi:phosphoribosyl 1,2-cyclic phosphodiesterase